MAHRHAEPREFGEALEGLDFPASQAAIIRKAQDKGGLDAEVLYILGQLPDRTYESMSDVESAIEAIYAEAPPLAGGGPAAPSRESTREKENIEARADTRQPDA